LGTLPTEDAGTTLIVEPTGVCPGSHDNHFHLDDVPVQLMNHDTWLPVAKPEFAADQFRD